MATQKELLKKRKKRWVPIQATRHFNNVEIGETITVEPSALIGRNVSINLMNLTQDIKTQNTKIVFKIKEVKDNKLLTEIVRYELVPASLKRMVHKEKEKIDDSFLATTKDNVNLKIKPFMVTKSSTNRSVLTALRKKAREVLTETIKKTTYEVFMEEVIRFKVQNFTKRELSKIYPLTQFQIRKLERLVQKSQ
jgi:ribosomal protein S3AE